MEIRPLTPDDLPEITKFGKMFFDEGKMPGTFNDAAFIKSWSPMLFTGYGSIIGAYDGGVFCGGIGGAVVPCFNTGDQIGMEMFWYVAQNKRSCGVRLLKSFEGWCKSRGAARVWMVHLTNLNGDKIERFYERFGYRLMEKFYAKEL